MQSPTGPAPSTRIRIAVDDAGPVQAVERHAERLHEAGVLQGDAGGQRRRARRVDPDLVGQAAVERDAVHGTERVPALGLRPGEAPVARTAVDDRQHGHRRPVVERSRELVAEDGPRRPHGRQVEVRPTDPRARHRHPDVALDGVPGGSDEADAVRRHLDTAHGQDPGLSSAARLGPQDGGAAAGPLSRGSTVIGGHGSGGLRPPSGPVAADRHREPGIHEAISWACDSVKPPASCTEP